ncbi:MAG: hypothetical protein AB1483_01540 [Candidatus Zixiibacteriota bacterium]
MAETANRKSVTPGANDVSSIFIGFELPGELLITDAQGRRVGFDSQTGESFEEIPKASYYREYIEDPDGNGDMESKHVEIMTPSSGDYKIVVSRVIDSAYNIGIFCYDSNKGSAPSRFDFSEISILPAATHAYTLGFDKTSSAQCFVTGGLVGGGESIEIDRLLSYVNIAEAKTELPPGTDSTDLFIIYSDAILAESFMAVLNEQDISNLFTPVAGGHEIVRLPVAAGKNVLTLSVRGKVTDEESTDIDELEFRAE